VPHAWLDLSLFYFSMKSLGICLCIFLLQGAGILI
jgi:hypothetical protein